MSRFVTFRLRDVTKRDNKIRSDGEVIPTSPLTDPKGKDGMNFHLIRFRLWRIEVKLLEISIR